MKTNILICLIAGLLCQCALSQTADDYVNDGLTNLAAQDIVGANANFAEALAVDPNHENANALYAITRLLVLPYQPAGSNFLTRIGFPTGGRSIYAWDSTPPKDSNGLLLAPSGVNANEFTAQLRTNVLLAVSGAINNLSLVTNTDYTIDLTSDETTMSDVTVDYGDLKLIQAGLYASEYFIYTLNAQNLDAQLTAVRALYTNGVLSASQMLADYPQLFTFSTTNDMLAARAAFTNAVNCYMTASAFIRARPDDEVRLFNYDKVSSNSETNFRSVLTDLENSLASAQVLSVKTNLTVDMANSFDGTTTFRSLLPQFQNNAIVLGSFPDLTFGGVIDGLKRGDVESYLSQYFLMLPFGNAPSVSGNALQLSFNTLKGHCYALEASTNFTDWQIVTNFTATCAVTILSDSGVNILPSRFYRLQEAELIVNNLDQPLADYYGPISTPLFLIGQEFTLPSDGGSYVLNKVTLPLSPTDGNGNISVSIWSVGLDNNPDTQIATVAAQYVASTGNFDFIPSTSIVLSAGTSYYVITEPATMGDSGLVGWSYTYSTSWTGSGVLGSFADTISDADWNNYGGSPQMMSVEAVRITP